MVQALASRPDVQRREVWAAPEDQSWRLRGRNREQVRLARLLSDIRSGRSGVLVLRGEAGVGKTALLEYLAERASGCRAGARRRRAGGHRARLCRAPADVCLVAWPARELARSAAQGVGRGLRSAPRACLIAFSLVSPSSGCWRRSPKPARWSAWSTMPNGLTERRRRRSRSSRDGCWANRSRSCSRCANRAQDQTFAGLPELPWFADWAMRTRARLLASVIRRAPR